MAGYRRRPQISAIGRVAGNGSVPPVVSWLRSLPAAEAAGAFAGERYGLTVRSCVLLRSPAGEACQVAAGGRRYAFRLCRRGGRPAGEVAREQDLAAHLTGRGVPLRGAGAAAGRQPVRRTGRTRRPAAVRCRNGQKERNRGRR
jgi:hypothetical protein